MRPVNNRSVYIFLGVCFLFLVAVVVLIVLINLPRTEEGLPLASPTPVTPSQRDKVRNRRTPSLPQAQGESGFTKEEYNNYLQMRKQADQTYQDRKRRMPFITKLPYSTSRFKIEITAVSDTIYITTFGPPSFQSRNREEALTWLRQNGGNPDQLTIQYKN